MAILAFDMGGTSVKYGVWDNEKLKNQGSFWTPKTWRKMKQNLIEIKKSMDVIYNSIEGVAFSAPGAVNQDKRQIEGTSKIPYIHFFPIYDELEQEFMVPVSFENDANSAALAEVWKGAAKDKKNVLLIVVGTAIGGSIIMNQKIQHGKHLFGGEFGFALLTEDREFGELATTVQMARRYAKRKGIPINKVDGKKVFHLAEAEGDPIAKEEVKTFYYYLAKGIYNLAYSFDPEIILLGGGVSNKDGLLEALDEQLDYILNKVELASFKPEIATCVFKSDSNLIGAVYNFLQKVE